MRSVRLRAHAKLNLTLDVGAKRDDGYHSIETIFQTISLADRLTFERADETTLRSEGLPMPTDPSNLILKAVDRFFEATKLERFATRIHVQKRIPSEAGLGGGSSDAAATLRALWLLAGQPFDAAELLPIAAQLGADVPFFLQGGAAFATGVGEQLHPLPPPPILPIAVVKPSEGVSTKWAYEALDAADRKPGAATEKLKSAAPRTAADLAPLLSNDFEPIVMAAKPSIAGAAQTLQNDGALRTLLCGSGSAVFGLFETPHAARTAARNAQTQGLWAAFCHFAPKEQTETVTLEP